MITKTPGVYVTESNTLPASIAGTSTAVPLFIGFTEKIPNLVPNTGLDFTPKRITSLFEFNNLFGGTHVPTFSVDVDTNNNINSVIPDQRFFLYDTLNLYFKNGGGPCYIRPLDIYENVTTATDFRDLFSTAIDETDNDTLDEVTLVLIPDLHFQYKDSSGPTDLLASLGDTTIYQTVVGQLINKCGTEKDKFALLDFHKHTNTASEIRNLITPDADKLKYSAVYYPWLKNAATVNLSFDSVQGYSLATGTNTYYDEIAIINDDLNLFNLAFPDGTSIDDFNTKYNTLNSEFNASSNAQAKLSAVFSYLFNLITNLETIETSASPLLLSAFSNLRNNENFIREVQKLLRFIKILNANNHAGTSTKYTNVAGFPPNTNSSLDEKWFNYSYTIPPVLFNNLIEDTTIYDATVILPASSSNSNKTRQQILTEFNQGSYVDYHLIFASVNQIVENLNARKQNLADQLFATDAVYGKIRTSIQSYMKQIPSQGAIAGIYCKNDRERGIWKSPANVSVQGIEKPLIEVSDSIQENFNVDTTGKSINVIRTFTGKGALVWGARTLAGNDNEWRYVSVRRFFSYAEKSIKMAMNDFVFEPNNSKTWVKINAMVSSFLVQQWRAGALIGNSPDEAFFVRIGKDTTTETEILAGKINIQIGMAMVRPAEFIILTFSHKSINQ